MYIGVVFWLIVFLLEDVFGSDRQPLPGAMCSKVAAIWYSLGASAAGLLMQPGVLGL